MVNLLSQNLWRLGNDGKATRQYCANKKLFASSGDSMTNAFTHKVDDVSYLYPFRSRPVAWRAQFLAPAVTVGETEGAMDSASVFFLPLLLPITL